MEWEGVGVAKRGLGCPCFPRIGWEGFLKVKRTMKKGLGASCGSQEWGENGFGRPKMKHEKGVRYFMVPKSGVGRAWEG